MCFEVDGRDEQAEWRQLMGAMDGLGFAAEEVAQMYVRDEVASVTTPVMQVRANRPP